MKKEKSGLKDWQVKVHEVIFEADTFWGKLFDILLILFIILSIVTVLLESVPSIGSQHGILLRTAEWIFTILFTIEYAARIISLKHPKHYIFSFYGIIDLLSILPTYLSLIFVGSHALIVIRIFRLLRIFRILKLVQFLGEADVLFQAIKSSLPKIIVFIIAVICISTIMGTLMYIVEGPENGYRSIPVSIYWTVVTLTTVGYGDIAPQTPLGQGLATILMILGYGIIAVPTGIVTAQLTGLKFQKRNVNKACQSCGKEGHDKGAKYCSHCGEPI